MITGAAVELSSVDVIRRLSPVDVFDIVALDNPVIADAVIVDMDLAFNLTQENAKKESEDYVVEAESKIIDFADGLSSMSQDDFDNQDSMNESIESQYNEIKTNVIDPLYSIPEVGDPGNFNLSNVSGILRSVLNVDFTLNPAIFNRSGLDVLSTLTKEGCSPYDLLNTIASSML